MKTRIVAIIALVFAAMMVGPSAAQASILNDAIIQNQSYSYYTITVCHDAATTNSCVAGHYGFLSPGQNVKTKYGWTDSDGIWCQAGWWCKIFSNTFRGSGTGWGSKFIKISGCTGFTAPVYVWKDNG
jgi:uncharacterized membrane protein YhiD involved in acid resistance